MVSLAKSSTSAPRPKTQGPHWPAGLLHGSGDRQQLRARFGDQTGTTEPAGAEPCEDGKLGERLDVRQERRPHSKRSSSHRQVLLKAL
jgi:hypothetical protein